MSSVPLGKPRRFVRLPERQNPLTPQEKVSCASAVQWDAETTTLAAMIGASRRRMNALRRKMGQLAFFIGPPWGSVSAVSPVLHRLHACRTSETHSTADSTRDCLCRCFNL